MRRQAKFTFDSPNSPNSPAGFAAVVGLIAVCLFISMFIQTETASSAGTALPVDAPARQDDLEITVDAGEGWALPGGTATYNLRLLNLSDVSAHGAYITFTLPVSFTYVPSSSSVTALGAVISTADPVSTGNTLSWGPFVAPPPSFSNNPYGMHTFVQDMCLDAFVDWQLEKAHDLTGDRGYVKQLIYGIETSTTGPSDCAVRFVTKSYEHKLVPILRLQGVYNPVGFWEKPDPGPDGDYSEIAAAFASVVDGLPKHDSIPLYIEVWNEPDLWVEWSGAPSASQYGRFFVAVSKAIRALGYERVYILNGGLTPGNDGFTRQLAAVPGFLNAFDLWASHCYPYNHPAWYNSHAGNARYPDYAIDCYLQEVAVLNAYGRGAKVMLTEGGYGLGDDVFAFEGFPAINETNRATYISDAYSRYWPAWREVRAFTPFELGSPWGGWDWLDWIDISLSLDPFSFSYAHHKQYDTVNALKPPTVTVNPRPLQVTFRAGVGDAPLGTYTGTLAASVLTGTAYLADAAPVMIVDDVYFMPTTYRRVSISGYALDAAPEMGGDAAIRQAGGGGDGVIAPTDILGPPGGGGMGADADAPAVTPATIEVGGYPVDAAPGGDGSLYVLLEGGRVVGVDAVGGVTPVVETGREMHHVVTGAAGQLYLAGDDAILLVDAASGRVLASVEGVSRPRGLAWDSTGGLLFVVEAGRDRLLVYRADLSASAGTIDLPGTPDDLLFDAAKRRLYVSLPGDRVLLAVGADSRRIEGEAGTVGGPLLDAALSPDGGTLYALAVLAPGYSGVVSCRADTMGEVEVLAGGDLYAMPGARAMAAYGAGMVVVAEPGRLWLVSTADRSAVPLAAETSNAPLRLVYDPAGHRIALLDGGKTALSTYEVGLAE